MTSLRFLGAGNSSGALVLTRLLTSHELYGIEVDARLRDLESKWCDFIIGKVILFAIFFFIFDNFFRSSLSNSCSWINFLSICLFD